VYRTSKYPKIRRNILHSPPRVRPTENPCLGVVFVVLNEICTPAWGKILHESTNGHCGTSESLESLLITRALESSFPVDCPRPWFKVVFHRKGWAMRTVRLSVLRDTTEYMPGWARNVPWCWSPSDHRATAHRDQTLAHGAAVMRPGTKPSGASRPKCCERYLRSGPNFDRNGANPYQTRPRLRRGPVTPRLMFG